MPSQPGSRRRNLAQGASQVVHKRVERDGPAFHPGRSARGRRPSTGRSRNSRRAASFKRRRVRLRTTALPTFLVTVKPMRAGPGSGRIMACKTRPGSAALRPSLATSRKSVRRFKRSGAGTQAPWPVGGPAPDPAPSCVLGRKLLAADPAAIGNDLAAANCGHAGAKAVAPLADQLRGLIGALHVTTPATASGARFRGPAAGAAYRRRRPAASIRSTSCAVGIHRQRRGVVAVWRPTPRCRPDTSQH